MFLKITFLKSGDQAEKNEACLSFLEEIFTKSVHRGGVVIEASFSAASLYLLTRFLSKHINQSNSNQRGVHLVSEKTQGSFFGIYFVALSNGEYPRVGKTK